MYIPYVPLQKIEAGFAAADLPRLGALPQAGKLTITAPRIDVLPNSHREILVGVAGGVALGFAGLMGERRRWGVAIGLGNVGRRFPGGWRTWWPRIEGA